jgi:dual specificity phosphatase 12
VLSHDIGKGADAFSWQKRKEQLGRHGSQQAMSTACSSYFTEPVEWMGEALRGVVEGKLLCPKCNSRLGAFNWAGMQCSCGQWITPAFQFHKSRVDDNKYPLASPTALTKDKITSILT